MDGELKTFEELFKLMPSGWKQKARGRFPFELRGFRLEEEWLSFYIRPMDGLQLPAIMQWVKQTFVVRFNRRVERTGHIWGDRY